VVDVIRVLIVEDEELVRATVEDSLSEGGFETVSRGSGEDAIALLQQSIDQYRAVVTDIVLGKVDGWEVARVAREIDPTMPIVYMTGTNGDEWPSKGVPNSVLLKKPFAPAQIVTAVAGLLNANPPPDNPENS
jgi:DNA-binding response OmpR family regulator